MLLIKLFRPFLFAQNLILAGLGANKLKFLTTFGISPWAMIFASIGKGLEEIFAQDTTISLAIIVKPEYLTQL